MVKYTAVKKCALLAFMTFFLFLTTGPSDAFAKDKAQDAEGSVKTPPKSGLVIIPIVFYTPETRWAGSVPFIYYYRDRDASPGSRPSSLRMMPFYTQRKQSVFQVAIEHYFRDEKYQGIAGITYSDYPQKFYGIGGDTSKDEEEDYKSKYSKIEGKLLRRVAPKLYLGIQGEAEKNEVIDPETGGLLQTGAVPGSEGGIFTGLGLISSWDSRDNVFYPSSGSFHRFSVMKLSKSLGGDFDFQRYNLDLRKYFMVLPNQILALNGFFDVLTGDVPYNRLAKIGGQDLMRGHFNGRYRDKNMYILQAEYRMQLWKGFGLAGFGGIGDVAGRVGDFRLSETKYALGCGLRYMIDPREKITMRLDFGITDDDAGIYLIFLEAI
jgi:outer membrane protein assembly factor BamA